MKILDYLKNNEKDLYDKIFYLKENKIESSIQLLYNDNNKIPHFEMLYGIKKHNFNNIKKNFENYKDKDLILPLSQLIEIENMIEKGNLAEFSINLEPEVLINKKFINILHNFNKNILKNNVKFEILEKKLINRNGKFLSNEEINKDKEFQNDLKDFFKVIKKLGIKISIDDFGQQGGHNTFQRINILQNLLKEINSKNILKNIKIDAEITIGYFLYHNPEKLYLFKNEYYSDNVNWGDLNQNKIEKIKNNSVKKIEELKQVLNNNDFLITIEFICNKEVFNFYKSQKDLKIDYFQGNYLHSKTNIEDFYNIQKILKQEKFRNLLKNIKEINVFDYSLNNINNDFSKEKQFKNTKKSNFNIN